MKKKILIFSAAGGGGHTAAAKALQSYLGDTYDVIAIYTFLEALQSIDPLAYVTRNRFTAVDLYNTALAKRQTAFLNTFATAGRIGLKTLKYPIKRLLKKTIDTYKPDCIISIIPFINSALLDVAHERNIPFLILPTDLDPRTYLYDIHNPIYSQFYFGRVVHDKAVDTYISNANIKNHQIIDTGFVVRKEFFEKKNPERIKKQFGIPDNIPVVMILLGSAGSDNTYKIAQALKTITKPCHIIFCIGKHTAMQNRLTQLSFPKHITKQIIGFTDDIANLMAVSDIFITKPGPNSICEALYMNTPLVIASLDKPLFWEKLNITYVQKHNLGYVAQTINELAHITTHLLNNPTELQEIKKRISLYSNENIEKNMRSALAYIFKKQEQEKIRKRFPINYLLCYSYP